MRTLLRNTRSRTSAHTHTLPNSQPGEHASAHTRARSREPRERALCARTSCACSLLYCTLFTAAPGYWLLSSGFSGCGCMMFASAFAPASAVMCVCVCKLWLLLLNTRVRAQARADTREAEPEPARQIASQPARQAGSQTAFGRASCVRELQISMHECTHRRLHAEVSDVFVSAPPPPPPQRKAQALTVAHFGFVSQCVWISERGFPRLRLVCRCTRKHTHTHKLRACT